MSKKLIVLLTTKPWSLSNPTIGLYFKLRKDFLLNITAFMNRSKYYCFYECTQILLLVWTDEANITADCKEANTTACKNIWSKYYCFYE